MFSLVGFGGFGFSASCPKCSMGSGGGIFQGFTFGFDSLVLFSCPWVLRGDESYCLLPLPLLYPSLVDLVRRRTMRYHYGIRSG